MSAVRKRLRAQNLNPPPPRSLRSLSSHDALLPPAPAGGGAQEEEEEEYLLVEEDTTDSSLIITMDDRQVEVKRRRAVRKRKRKSAVEEEERGGVSESEEEEEAGVEVEIDRQLDQSLETKSKQHNLTTVNVRNILHEVITNEHVVAMMKAAINETEAVPAFEPKMTRSKFKEVVEKGVVIPAWNISPIKKSEVNKAPQFVDIPLAEEDSSDEEYHPDEEDEDETAEDTFQESDMESSASSPRGSRLNRAEEDSCSPWQASRSRSRHLRAAASSMGPPPPPKAPPPRPVPDCTFLEELHAVEEELAVCIEPYQPLPESEEAVGLMAYRTRSKRPLRDVPLGRLEAELRAPDITADMYKFSSAHEDRDWTDWLRGLMTSDMENEEECDDEDDPEYNFLADTDEPDVEDYRDDKAVRITKKEVNELMEELFETLKEDLAGQEVEDEGHEEEEEPQEESVHTHTPEEQLNLSPGGEGEEPGLEQRTVKLRTVKQQIAFLRSRRQLGLPTHTHTHAHTVSSTHTHTEDTLQLSRQQRSRLQQQLQQHVQLLTQIQLLSSPVVKLQSEAETSRQFLVELQLLAQRAELLMPSGVCSVFRASNLQGALQLLQDLKQNPIQHQQQNHRPDSRGHMRCFPVLPAELSWLFATRPVFLYPELLPSASLDPDLYCPRRTAAFTAAEDCLLVLGLRNMEGSCDPTKLVSQFLLRKTLVQVRRRILQCCRPGSPDNIVKAFRYHRVLRPMLVSCRPAAPEERRPPVEREEASMPLWLLRSLPAIHTSIQDYNGPSGPASRAPPPCSDPASRAPPTCHMTLLRSPADSYSFPPGTRYPPRLPKHLDFRRMGFVLQQPRPRARPDSSPIPDFSPLHDSPLCDSSPLQDSSPRARPDSSPLHDSSPHARPDSSPIPDSSPLHDSPLRDSSPLHDCSPRARPDSSPLHDASPHPPSDSSPLPDRQLGSAPPRVLRLLLSRTDAPADVVSAPAVSVTIRERIRRHRRTLANLRRKSEERGGPEAGTPPEGHAHFQGVAQESDDVIGTNEEEEEEEESEVFLVLSESSPSSTGSINPEEAEPEREQEVTSPPCTADNDDDDDDDDEDDQTEEEEAFAEDYLLRVCDVVQVCSGVSEQLLQVLDRCSSSSSSSSVQLFRGLSVVLRPWPQLLRDFAAFLNHQQAHRCGLLTEQRMFQRSRRFLRRLGRSLGEGSSPFQQVVSVLQGSPAPPPEDMVKISSLLSRHSDLHKEFWDFFQQLHASETDFKSQNPPLRRSRKRVERRAPEGAESEGAESERPVGAKNMSMTSSGEKVVVWTREADRAILTACQQRGANRKTFRQVSAQLGNKTANQVRLRFSDLMTLFHKSTSCS